jgi:penicillin-binding protein 1C
MAFDDGMAHPESLIDDRPASFDGYAPQNFDRQYRGTLRVREALQLSLNLPVVALADALGPARIMAALRRAGARAVLPGDGTPGLAVVLGGVGMSLEGLVQLYAGLARGGQAVALRVQADGTYAPAGPPARVLSAVAAWQVGDILASAAPPPGAPQARMAYKTGTSYGHRDAWALGYDGGHVAGVWMGRADGTPVPGVFGADLAAPLLFEVFARIKPQLAPLPPPPQSTLIVPNAALPQPLQRFHPRGDTPFAAPDAPVLAFPPAGAEILLDGGPLVARVERGAAPFTWLADGVPVAIGARGREALLDLAGPGFVTLSVIDARGRSAGVQVLVR